MEAVRYLRLALATLLIPLAVWLVVSGLPHTGYYRTHCSSGAIARESQAPLPRLTTVNRATLGAACSGELRHGLEEVFGAIAVAAGVLLLLRGRPNPQVDTQASPLTTS